MKLSSILYVIAFLGAVAVMIGVVLSILSEEIGIAYIMIGSTITILSVWTRNRLEKTGNEHINK